MIGFARLSICRPRLALAVWLVLAALLVAAVGTISMLAGFGEVAVLGHVMSLDPVGVALGTMTGLALGVGFALLILDRFPRERRPGADAAQTAAGAIRELQTTGRAVLVGGTAIVMALALAAPARSAPAPPAPDPVGAPS